MDKQRSAYFNTPKYTRGRVCKVLGISKDTLRYYEEYGLVKPWTNPNNRYKYYSIADLEILGVILFLRSIDVSVIDIPKAIECREIDKYKNFLREHHTYVEEKIRYFKGVTKMLSYLEDTISDFQKYPNEEKVVENTEFNFQVTKFTFQNDNIEDMVPKEKSDNATYHIIKLKIAGPKWINSNRKDETDLITGHLCDDISNNSQYRHVIPFALNFNTFCELKDIPEVIQEKKKKYSEKYIFGEKVYIVEHICVNVYNQDALLRSIYIPILEFKKEAN